MEAATLRATKVEEMRAVENCILLSSGGFGNNLPLEEYQEKGIVLYVQIFARVSVLISSV